MTNVIAVSLVIAFALMLIFLCYGLLQQKEQFQSPYNKGYDFQPNLGLNGDITPIEKSNSLYSHIIYRPKDIYAHSYGGNCTNELYPKRSSPYGKGEIAGPCCPDIGGKYYGMRPILTYEMIQDMVMELYKHITDRVPSQVDKKSLRFQNQFSDGDSFTEVMRYILGRINHTQAQLPIFKQYAKADTWGGDQFAYLNEQIFMLTATDPSKYSEQEQARMARKNNNNDVKYVVTFTLYMPLRSMSLDTKAVVIKHKNKYYIESIEFISQNVSQNESQNVPQGVSLDTDISQPEGVGQSSTPDWIYGNTLENKTFNLKGFHDPDESNNILIPGGVPEEFGEVLDKCDQGYLLNPAGSTGPRMKGGYQMDSNKFTAPVFPNFPNKDTQWNVRV